MKQHLPALMLVASLCVLSTAAWSQEDGDSILAPEPAETDAEAGSMMDDTGDGAPMAEDMTRDDGIEPQPMRQDMIKQRGDVLDMPATSAGPPPSQSMPYHGMKMYEVERQYGSPLSRQPAVGNPPITRWDYDGFSVFFEHSTVLHSVQEGRPAEIEHKDELQPATRNY